MITQEQLLRVIHYDSGSGVFTRLQCGYAPANGKYVGKQCGFLNYAGYLRIGIGSREYMAHRLAWLYMTGVWPQIDIDHIDGQRANNRWENLRLATRSQNMQNMRCAKANSKTGYIGVSPMKNRFRATITVNKRQIWIGSFATAEEASAAYVSAKRRVHERGPI
jgi:hypothetical protein